MGDKKTGLQLISELLCVQAILTLTKIYNKFRSEIMAIHSLERVNPIRHLSVSSPCGAVKMCVCMCVCVVANV